jgi:hypothetical protein
MPLWILGLLCVSDPPRQNPTSPLAEFPTLLPTIWYSSAASRRFSKATATTIHHQCAPCSPLFNSTLTQSGSILQYWGHTSSAALIRPQHLLSSRLMPTWEHVVFRHRNVCIIACNEIIENTLFFSMFLSPEKTKLRGLSPRTNYTDRATTAYQRS